MIRLVRCCFVGCGEQVDWGDDDLVVANWLLFHVFTVGPIVSVWLCPKHAERYGWKNIDLRRVKTVGPLPEESAIVGGALELLAREDPEAFDPDKALMGEGIPGEGILSAMKAKGWSIRATSLLWYRHEYETYET